MQYTLFEVRFSSCSACCYGPLLLTKDLIGYHMTEFVPRG